MSDFTLEIHKYPRFVVLKTTNPTILTDMYQLVNKFSVYNFFQKKQLYSKKVSPREKANIKPARYFGGLYDNTELRFHISDYKDIKLWLEVNNIKNIDVYEHECCPGKDIDLELKEGWVPRDYQVEPIEWITKPGDKILTFQPGDGKTFMCVAALSKLKKRTVFVIKPRYIDKWIGDLQELSNTTEDRILPIQGGYSLNEWLEAYREEDQGHDFVLISNRTFMDYLKKYEQGFGSDIDPQDYCNVLNAGILVVDEVHQDFNFNYRLSTYTTACKFIGMSGTFISSDRDISSKMWRLFPKDTRLKPRTKPAYIDIYAVRYKFAFTHIPKEYHYTLAGAYNHIRYERFIMANIYRLYDYVKLIEEYFQTYIDRREDGDKCLIYAASIMMCHFLANYIKLNYPEFKTTTKVEGDIYDVIIENDIIVSTVQSSGTAFDIPNLITVVQTMSIDTSQSNLQALGRLRDLKSKKMEFYYLYSTDVQKHTTYHFNKKELFQSLAKKFRSIAYDKSLGDSYNVARTNKKVRSEVAELEILRDYIFLRDIKINYPKQIKQTKEAITKSAGKKKGWLRRKLNNLEREYREYLSKEKEIIQSFEDLF